MKLLRKLNKSEYPQNQPYVYIICDTRKLANEFSQFLIEFEPFYVGKGINERYRDVKNKKVNNRVAEMLADGCEPKVVFIPYPEHNIAYRAEQDIIESIGRQSKGTGPLLNLKRGGIGGFADGGAWNKGLKGLPAWNKGLSNDAVKGSKFYNDGITQRMCFDGEQPEGWRQGRLPSERVYAKGIKREPCKDEAKKKIAIANRKYLYRVTIDDKTYTTDDLGSFVIENGLPATAVVNLRYAARNGTKYCGIIISRVSKET